MKNRFSTILFKTISDIANVKKKVTIAMLISLSLFLLSISQANATLVYSNNFDGKVVDLNGWAISADKGTGSTIKTDTVPNPEISPYWGTFLGQFGGNDAVTLSLTGLSEGWVTLSLDTYFIRSWDGEAAKDDYGSDYFTITTNNLLINNEYILYNSFSNGNSAGQSYNKGDRVSYTEGKNNSMQGSKYQYAFGYTFYDAITGKTQNMDSGYYFTYSFYNTSSELSFIFAGINLQDSPVTDPATGKIYLDESWGLDNVKVDVAPVPEPSTLLLLASGAVGLIPLRYRRKKN
jgi:hypothetical protein